MFLLRRISVLSFVSFIIVAIKIRICYEQISFEDHESKYIQTAESAARFVFSLCHFYYEKL